MICKFSYSHFNLVTVKTLVKLYTSVQPIDCVLASFYAMFLSLKIANIPKFLGIAPSDPLKFILCSGPYNIIIQGALPPHYCRSEV